MEVLKLTKEGKEKLEQDLEAKKEELRKLGEYKSSAAANEGDAWHDNFAFEQTEIKERALIHEVNDLQEKINTAEIIEVNTKDSNKVTVGTKVKVLLQYAKDDQEECIFTIIGEFGNMDPNTVSMNSPVAKCILGQSVGFEGTYTVNSNKIGVKILSLTN